MTKIDKAKAMKCFGSLVEQVELDPDPQAFDKARKEYNCAECDSRQYCDKLAWTLA